MKNKLISAVLTLCVALPVFAETKAPAPATPAEKPVVSVSLTQTKIVTGAGGREREVDAKSVRPGDVIEYQATYTNNSKLPVKGLLAGLPIPEGLEYLPNSAKPGGAIVKAAAKQGEFAAEPLMRNGAAGKPEPVPYNEYRSLRWEIGQLKAGASVTVRARAKVEGGVPTVNAGAQPVEPRAPPAAAPQTTKTK
ncbi:MAG: hypothetical protein V4857_04450 [Pseudomonadota bacterium]